MTYTYHQDQNGVDDTFDVMTPDGEHFVSVPFWDAAEEAEARAKLIVDALNTYQPPLFEAVK